MLPWASYASDGSGPTVDREPQVPVEALLLAFVRVVPARRSAWLVVMLGPGHGNLQIR